MTIDEFRSHAQFPALWAKELSENYILGIVLGVLDDAHPAKYTVPADNDGDLSPTRAAVELEMTRGYSKYGDTLRLLAKQKRKVTDIGEPTYSEPVGALQQNG